MWMTENLKSARYNDGTNRIRKNVTFFILFDS